MVRTDREARKWSELIGSWRILRKRRCYVWRHLSVGATGCAGWGE
jgi:hypothetical protein